MIDYDACHYMELAIEVMRKSIPERRADGRVSPRVGAVLLNLGTQIPPGGRVSSAFRCELRDGDHAEYTLLERKHREHSLQDCVLFTTLEPCAPRLRNHSQPSCAELIVQARIREVWIGIEDPDPPVDRKGIRYLQDNGVTVRMFDRELQEIIRHENREFIEQAMGDAAAEHAQSHEVILSSLESSPGHCHFDDFSEEALQEYRSRAGITADLTSAIFLRRLIRLGLLREYEETILPTGFGMLLFGEEPRTVMPQCGLLATILDPDGTEDVRDFDGPQVFVPDEAMKWLSDSLPSLFDPEQDAQTGQCELLNELVREGIVNALVHRDYSIAGAKCHLTVTPHSIEIRSPGMPIEPITLDQMQSFSAPMLSRNPLLHYMFAKMQLAEERSLGLKSMRQRAEAVGLPLPRYTWNDPYLTLTLFPAPSSHSPLFSSVAR